MSKFSTIDSQHGALRDLERQRLERMMGQLRREVDCSDGTKVQQRRFQPPKRADNPSKPAPRVPRASIAESGKEGRSSSKRSSSTGDGREPQPGPAPGEVLSGSPSVEMAWLMQVSSQMDTEQEEVQVFLARHGLDRYASLLVEDPAGIGSSMEEMRQADDARLAEAGLLASPRRHLLAALAQLQENELAEVQRSSASSSSAVAYAAPPDGSATPGSAFFTDVDAERASASALSKGRPEGSPLPVNFSNRLLASGWEKRRPTSAAPVNDKVRLLAAPVTKADASCGDDDGVGGEGDALEDASYAVGFLAPRVPDVFTLDSVIGGEDVAEISRASASVGCAVENSGDPPLSDAVSEALEQQSRPASSLLLFQRPPSGMLTDRRPSSASSSTVGIQSSMSRAGSKAASSSESVCCYQCYKQVHPQFTVEVGEAAPRRFCGSACADRFRAAQSLRQAERDRKLAELRTSLEEEGASGVNAEIGSTAIRNEAVLCGSGPSPHSTVSVGGKVGASIGV